MSFALEVRREKLPVFTDDMLNSFNCLLPAHQCTQFADCNDYTGKCNCPEGFGGDDCIEPRTWSPLKSDIIYGCLY